MTEPAPMRTGVTDVTDYSVPPYACARVRAKEGTGRICHICHTCRSAGRSAQSDPRPSTGPPQPPSIRRRRPAPPSTRPPSSSTTDSLNRQETIMAVATLTLPDRNASLPVPAAPAASAHHPRARPRHHHRLGAARARRPDHQRHGVVPPQPLRRRRHALPALHQLADRARPAERADRGDLVRGGPPACRHRRGARLRRADGDADRLGRAPRRALPGRAGRHDQDPRHRQGQRAEGGHDRCRAGPRLLARPTTTRRTRSPSCIWAIDTRGGVR